MLCVSMFIALTMRNLLPLSITCYPSAWPPFMSPAPPLPRAGPSSLGAAQPLHCLHPASSSRPQRVRPRGHAPSGRKTDNCLSAQQSSFKRKDEAKTYSDKQNWEGIARGPSAGTCRGSHPADKEDSREEGGGRRKLV